MDTDSILCEITTIDKELSRLHKDMRVLSTRKKNLISQAVENMQSMGQTRHDHAGKTYILEEKTLHTRKPTKKKHDDAILVLHEEGFDGTQAEEMYDKITNAMRGPTKLSYILKR